MTAGPALAVEWHSWPDLSGDDVYDLMRLRSEVFVVEQRCAYLDPDGADRLPGTWHALVRDETPAGGVVACLRVGTGSWSPLEPGPPGRPRAETGHYIGRVCTRADRRGLRLAGRLLDEAVTRFGAGPLTLQAQIQMRPWYTRWGFVEASEPYDEDGILHVSMHRV